MSKTKEFTPFTLAETSVKGYVAIYNRLGQKLLIPEQTFEVTEKLLESGSHVFLYGHAGTAKTELAETLIKHMGRESYQFETGSITSGEQLDGRFCRLIG